MSISIPKMGENSVAQIDLSTENYPINWHHDFKGWNDKSQAYTRVDAENVPANYFPLQIHWHTPSEHATKDKDGNEVHYSAEAHIVHADEGGNNLSVLGIFFDVPKAFTSDDQGESEFIKNFFEGFADAEKDDENEAKGEINMDLLITELRKDSGFWMYDGSLTTPPCTEGVKWTVLKGELSMSKNQLDKMSEFTKGTYQKPTDGTPAKIEQKYLDDVNINTVNPSKGGGNNRKIQPLEDRKLYMYDENKDEVANSKFGSSASSLMASLAAAITTATLLSF